MSLADSQRRRLQDASLRRGRNVPRGGQVSVIDGIAGDVFYPLDITAASFRPDELCGRLEIPAMALDDGHSVEFRLQDSDAEAGAFADTCPEVGCKVTGADGLG